MTNKIKEILLFSFTISLVAAYFMCFGYYANYNIDISAFLSLEDLTMIYTKWIWIVFFLALLTVSFINGFYHSYIKNLGEKNTWWDKPIGKTIIKRRALIMTPISILFVIIFFGAPYFFKEYENVVNSFYTAIMLLGMGSLFFMVTALTLRKKNDVRKLKLREIVFITMSTIFLIVFIPMILGSAYSKLSEKDNIVITFEDNKIINTKENGNLVFIGKTSKYVFIQNSKINSISIYNIDKIKILEFLH